MPTKKNRLLIRLDSAQTIHFADPKRDDLVVIPPGESEHEAEGVSWALPLLQQHPQVTIRELAA